MNHRQRRLRDGIGLNPQRALVPRQSMVSFNLLIPGVQFSYGGGDEQSPHRVRRYPRGSSSLDSRLAAGWKYEIADNPQAQRFRAESVPKALAGGAYGGFERSPGLPAIVT